jgi:hypothetical protein
MTTGSGPAVTLAPDRYSGRRLGKYEIVCRLSTGGMAAIYLAFQRGHAGFTKLVVLKQILPDVKAEQELVDMFLDEAKITAAFNHPNIAHVYDLDISDDELFLSMEFVAGADLLEIARACHEAQEPIPIGFTLAVVRDTALALHYAHTFTDPLGRPHPVIHRDVAEKNIMVTYEGQTKLLDFGIAKAKDRNTRTAAGMVKGTLGYMSPEQLRGKELDPRTDVYSLGVVFHECLTGMRLFHGEDHEAEIMAALETDAAPPSDQNPEVPPEIDAVVLKALKRNREERFSSALEFARAIERAAGGRMWHQEQCGAQVVRYFADRREQTRQLLANEAAAAAEATRHKPREQREARDARDAREGRAARSSGERPQRLPPPRVPKGVSNDALKAQLAEIAAGISPADLKNLNLTGALPMAPPRSDPAWMDPAPSTRPAEPAVGDSRDGDEEDDRDALDYDSGERTRDTGYREPSGPYNDGETVVRAPVPPKRRSGVNPYSKDEPTSKPARSSPAPSRREAPRELPPRRRPVEDSSFSTFKLAAMVFAVLVAGALVLAFVLRLLRPE